MNLIKRSLVIVICTLIGACTSKVKQFSEKDIHIIPKPVELKLNEGFFEFTKNTKFVPNNFSKEVVSTLRNKFKNVAGWDLEIKDETPVDNYVEFVLNDTLKSEGYTITVTSKKITVLAKDASGLMYGLETIRQLLPIEIESKEEVFEVDWVVPNVEVKDEPRYKWRGLMLDVSRHFFGKEYVKQVIDGLAMHKMNVLHLHLVDDQGWRIEIKKYPKLTEIGALRVDQEDLHWNRRKVNTSEEKGTFGGFYSQEDIKEIVSYATSKGVEVVPEIEMPAHVMSAIASYPELSCFETPIGVPSGGVWPITEIYCAGKETTFEFLENVLLEVIALFPSKYIHIGGDEARKTNWAKCKHCKKRMKEQGLHDVEQLQSYFIKRMEKFINAHDRKLIGWDEILEGGLAPDATVMSWRGVKGGVEAAKQGHNVIMTPNSHCYFDHYQGPQDDEPLAISGHLTLSKVYKFDPIVESMSKEEASYVLGGQANLWAEYIPTEEHSEYMIYPRLAALSEAIWSPKELRDWDDFSNRISFMFKRYEQLGINYAKSAYLVTVDAQMDITEKVIEVKLKNEFPKSDIRYSLDGSELYSSSNKYTQPIKISKTTNIKASIFKKNKPVGKSFNQTIKFHKAVGKQVSYNVAFSEKYKGVQDFNMVNTIRGTKNFHDGQWQAWLGKDMDVIIDLEKETLISKVTVGSMENQGPGIYYPTKIEVLISQDGKNYKIAGSISREFANNSGSELKDFHIEFSEEKTRFVKVKATSLKKTATGGGVWLFVDEILID